MKQVWSRFVFTSVCLVFASGLPLSADALSARLRYDQLLSSKDPYLGKHNERATLAWGASYHLRSYVIMFETTNERVYLDRAVALIDSLLKQRDDNRRVKDYRGVSGACWRNLHYQPNNQPYCYVVHSGMITYPMARLAELVLKRSWANAKMANGATYRTKMNMYIAEVRKTIAYHNSQWKSKGSIQGYYVFRNASFLRFAGKAMPLNQQNALGMTLAVMERVTKSADMRSKLRRMCVYFRALIATQKGGSVWNYWPTKYKTPGEDISHAAINVNFAVECVRSKTGMTRSDLIRMGRGFFNNVYRSSTSWAKFVGGGVGANAIYSNAVGRWLSLAEFFPVIYGPIRSYYDIAKASMKSASGSGLLPFAYLARFEPKYAHHGFYVVDWKDRGSYRQALKYGANLIVKPYDPKMPVLVRLRYASYGNIEHQQWNGKVYTTIQKLPNTKGKVRQEWFVFDPSLWKSYSQGHALFQFKDLPFTSGKGIRVWEQKSIVAPKITSKPRKTAVVGVPYKYDADNIPAASGTGPFRWFRGANSPAAVAATNGKLSWTPTKAGTVSLSLRVVSNAGKATQTWSVVVSKPAPEPVEEPQQEPVKEVVTEVSPESAPDEVVEEATSEVVSEFSSESTGNDAGSSGEGEPSEPPKESEVLEEVVSETTNNDGGGVDEPSVDAEPSDSTPDSVNVDVGTNDAGNPDRPDATLSDVSGSPDSGNGTDDANPTDTGVRTDFGTPESELVADKDGGASGGDSNPPRGGGCGCQTTEPQPFVWAWLLFLAVWIRRKKPAL